MRQSTDTILMVKPSHFRKNEDTAVNNYFQTEEDTANNTQELALTEFNAFVEALENNGIRVIVVQDSGELDTPDSIFPNNVISFHGSKAVLYPMFAENRRRERKLNVLGELQKLRIEFERIIDYSIYEEQQLFLEGTGVLVLDRVNKIAYCSLSPRATQTLVDRFCEDLGYKSLVFEALQNVDGEPLPIYHTNVMMAIADQFAVICLDSIKDKNQRELVEESLRSSGREIMAITEDQMNHFCGNILALRSKNGEQSLIVMSEQAFKHFTEKQKEQLSEYGDIVQSPLYTIEKYGGGSARCMIAEIFQA
ncbi:citrulline utilization hydrolase CtlX [Sphingobacterium corticis]|uniref:Citrulline utilization hydrolase CtlX n=1 Tax=Sphingobacterium corticis TaxID=1812823 RepID=A0ABW5NI19_9SPHI